MEKGQEIDVQKAHNGMLTAKITLIDGFSFYLHSPDNPILEAQKWVQQFEIKSSHAYVILGFGLGYHIKFLLEVLPEDSQIFVIEHSKEKSLARFVKQHFSNVGWMANKRLHFIAGPDIREIAGNLNKQLQSFSLKQITICKHLPTMATEKEFYLRLERDLVKKVQDLLMVDYNFRTASSKVMLKHAWENFSSIRSNPGISHFKDKFKGFPAIVVSSGPSLNKNIDKLKEYADKAVIICVGSALGALKKHNLTPHFLVVVDPFPGMEKCFEGCLSEDTVLVSPYVTPSNLIDQYPGKKVFYLMAETHRNVNVLGALKEYLPQTDVLIINLSVAVPAIHFARYIGADPIILMGQDLSFTPDATHAQGTQYSSYSKDYCHTVKGVNGESLLANMGFKELLDYFTGWFKTFEDCLVINATEGGVYIEGIPHMLLSRVAEKYFIEKRNIFKEIHHVVEKKIFTKSDDVLHKLSQILNDIEDCQIHARNIGLDIQKLNGIGDQTDIDEITNTINEIRKRLRQLKEMPAYAYIDSFMELWFELSDFKRSQSLSIIEQRNLYYWLNGQFQAVLEDLKEMVAAAREKIGSAS
jgi:hypothetical protein